MLQGEPLTVRDELFNEIVNLGGFLGLPASFRDDHIRADVVRGARRVQAFLPNQTGLFGMLQVEAVAFRQPPIHRGLDPRDVVHQAVPHR